MHLWLPKAMREGLRANASASFNPAQQSKVSGWLRVAQGTVTGQGYSSIPDVLLANPAVQSTDARRPAAATSANGLPILSFSGTNVLSWPLAANNNLVTTTGFAAWIKPTAVASTQRVAIIHTGAGGANTNVFHATLVATGKAEVVAYANAGGLNKVGDTSGTPIAAGTWAFVRWMFVSGGATDADKILIYVNGALQALTITGSGTLTTLPTPTGNILLGNLSNDGTFASPFTGNYGPNLFWLSADLSAAEETALMNFERPT